MEYIIKIGETELDHIKKYKVQRNKLWKDADRNMAGDLRSTFVGVFPKIIVEFTHQPADDMRTLVGLLEEPSFTVYWYDEITQTNQSGTYYAGDYEMSFYDVTTGLYEPMTVSLIPFSKHVAIPSA